MIFNMMIGGGSLGGASLKLNAISTADDLPTSAKVGEVYLVTDATLTGVSYLQPTAPTEGLTAGDVWIGTNEKSPVKLNMAKKGSLIIGFSTAKVWDGTAWANVSFYVWNGTGWDDAVSSGSLISSGVSNVEFSITTVTATVENGMLHLAPVSGDHGLYKTVEMIDLTNYTALKCTGQNTGGESAWAGVWGPANTNPDQTEKVKLTADVSTVTLDITDLTGQYTVGIHGNNHGGTLDRFNIFVKDLWLE